MFPIVPLPLLLQNSKKGSAGTAPAPVVTFTTQVEGFQQKIIMLERSIEELKKEQVGAHEPQRCSPGCAPAPGEHKYDVCEVFSPPRICATARKQGLAAGWSLDISVKDPETGRKFDLRNSKDQKEGAALRAHNRPRISEAAVDVVRRGALQHPKQISTDAPACSTHSHALLPQPILSSALSWCRGH